MGDDLVTVEIEVHPMRARAAFFATEQVEIEAARGGEIVGREGEVEGLDGHDALFGCVGSLILGREIIG